MPRNQDHPKAEDQDREPQAQGQRDLKFEPEVDESRHVRMHRQTGAEAEDDELAERDLESLVEDDLRDMEGPDA